jgi:rfaE bifunctional protein kinase chain/domain
MNVKYSTKRLLDAVDRFPDVRVLVVGDVMLDEFIWGTVDRISPEAPVPVVNVTAETRLLGGAANVVNNIVSAGGKAALAGVVGHDRPGREVARMLDDLGVDPTGMIVDRNRPTTIKTRVVAHAQQVVRFDRENRRPISRSPRNKVFDYLGTMMDKTQAVIVSDYGKGLITQELMDQVRAVYARPGRVIAVDPKVQNFDLYRQVTVITPNTNEASLGSGIKIESEETLIKAGEKILQKLECSSVLITRGESGMALFERDRPVVHIPTVAREVYDVTGAGDTVIAIMTLGRAAGLDRLESAVLANFAAGVVVGEVGTSAVSADGLKQRILQDAKSKS